MKLVRLALLLVALALAALLFAVARAPSLARTALESAALRRGFAASFTDLRVGWGPSIHISRLALRRPGAADTTVAAESLDVRLSLFSLLRGSTTPSALRLAHARITARRGSADPDTLSPEGEDAGPSRASADRVRRAARELVRTLLLPARTLPELDLRDVTLVRAAEDSEAAGLQIDRLRLEHSGSSARLSLAGTLLREQPMPFAGEMSYASDDRVTGRARFQIPDAAGKLWPVEMDIDGRVHQDRGRRRVEILQPTRVRVGEMTFGLTGQLSHDGPALAFELAADSLSDLRLQRSLPPPVLGPLRDVGTRGTWDYRLKLDLDFARPDSVDFSADVIPHGLALDPARTRLDLLGLGGPFVAHIHLPHRRIVDRALSNANPAFRTLAEIDPFLVNAVVTNEDGAFFRHRGFNTESVREAIAENLKAGAYRRGAGTITMQLARNLWLGHERTLSRKAQEVMLAWVLENLTGLGKQRLLEIYLNIIEWGPGIHGAEEAARYYFGHDVSRLTIDEALFLTILVPSPTKWSWRLDRAGQLRSFARAQMHFIGRAMIAKGWLHADELPPADQMFVNLRGPAGDRYQVAPPLEQEPGGVEAADVGRAVPTTGVRIR